MFQAAALPAVSGVVPAADGDAAPSGVAFPVLLRDAVRVAVRYAELAGDSVGEGGVEEPPVRVRVADCVGEPVAAPVADAVGEPLSDTVAVIEPGRGAASLALHRRG